MSGTVEWNAWQAMIKRCHSPRAGNFAKYGARGITVCDEWRGRGGFERFYEHIGPKPEDADCIDRIDGSRGYEPGNVRWLSWSDSNRNRRAMPRDELGRIAAKQRQACQ